jgi:hypothetical protein
VLFPILIGIVWSIFTLCAALVWLRVHSILEERIIGATVRGAGVALIFGTVGGLVYQLFLLLGFWRTTIRRSLAGAMAGVVASGSWAFVPATELALPLVQQMPMWLRLFTSAANGAIVGAVLATAATTARRRPA